LSKALSLSYVFGSTVVVLVTFSSDAFNELFHAYWYSFPETKVFVHE